MTPTNDDDNWAAAVDRPFENAQSAAPRSLFCQALFVTRIMSDHLVKENNKLVDQPLG